MAWSNSKVFRAYIGDLVQGTVENQGTTSMDWVEATSIKIALYDNDITPDQNVTAANTAYNVGQWVLTGNEVIDTTGGGTDWPAGGVNLASRAVNVATNGFVRLTAANTASGATADILNAFGGLVYADSITTPVADQGFCYNYFGGANSVTNGTFTVVWNATSGVIQFTL